ncbi:MAG: heat-shock protein Hsp20 [Planctomycetaceae bacterium]|nr:heat-shock protein Hsp20 [Planctomycetaceae bacterium]
MAVFRWGQNWDAFHDLEREVDRLLQSVNLTFQGLRFGRQYPPVNLYELDEEYLLTAEVPGTRGEDLELTVAGGVLSIKGRRSDLEEIPSERFRRQERPRGTWQRSLKIPERIEEDQMSAEFNNGILKIHLPKAEALQARQIPIAEGGE